MKDVSRPNSPLSPKRKALLVKLLKKDGVDVSRSQISPRKRDSDLLPTSFAQQRLWFLHELGPGGPAYNIPVAHRIAGPLKVPVLCQCLNEIVRRHESLRTTFTAIDGKPMQSISEWTDSMLPVVDLSGLPSTAREAEAARLSIEEAKRPFDFVRGPLFRSTLLRLSEREHVVFLTMHHIISDGWSIAVLNRELTALYKAFSQGLPSPLPALPIQYADFAVWQTQWLQGEVLEKQLAYWKQHLANALTTLELPIDRPRPAVMRFKGDVQKLILPDDITNKLRALSRREGATLFITLLAAFNALLYRYAGQEDILIGTPIAGRTRAEIEGLIGFFVNMLVLRTDLSGNPGFQELLTRVRDVFSESYSHQDLPFEKLVEELNLEREVTRSPLFQTMFVFTTPSDALELSGLEVSDFKIDIVSAKFDLTMSLLDMDQVLEVALDYNTDLFDASTIARMLGHYQTLLAAIVADPEQQLSALRLLSEREQYQLIEEWNETRAAYPRALCIHELFEAQVERTPEAIAVVSEQEEISYAELNRRANQLAHYLRGLGVGAETLVGLALKRSVELVVGVLGVLKAGGGYVPLEAGYPRERLQYMMEDAGVSVLVTEAELAEQLPAHWGQTVCVDREREAIAAQSGENVRSEVSAANVAYVIYTSGSSGKPKGVLVEHGSLGNYLHWVNESLLREKENIPLVTSLSFDGSLKQLWAPLLRGAGVWIVSSETVLEPRVLVEALSQRSRVTLNCVPSLWASLLARMDDEQRAVAGQSLACLLLGGEALNEELRDKTFQAMPAVEIWNVYGPTETTGNASAGRMAAREVVTIGRPIANTEIYILDAGLNPTPIGVVGELYIGGAGLARGYLHRPELTAEKFIPHPFARTEGARLYRTGDRGRYQADGNIEYLGRLDEQVKVRGYRIELGEIEAALREHPALQDAIVIKIEDEREESRLVGYVVTGTEQRPEQRELREWLKQKLPDYMVPQLFVQLESLPLTANGKVDRRALPAAAEQGWELSDGYVAPRTGLEELVANIWAGVLGVERVGIHDNFFELGGHSLLATQVISRVREAVQVELAVSSLFEEPTVAGQARRCEELRRTQQQIAPPLQRQRRDSALPLSFAQQRLWFIHQLAPESQAYKIPSAFRLNGQLNIKTLERSINEIINRHEVLRTTFTMVHGECMQVIAAPNVFTLPVLDLQYLTEPAQEAEVQRLVNEEVLRSFDLNSGPLFRVTLLCLKRDEYILIFNIHHIIFDGWSLKILTEELATLYKAFSAGQPSPLPDLAIQYADFAVWQREWLQGETFKQQLSYWTQRLEGISRLQLPHDKPRLPVQTFQGANQYLTLSSRLTKKIKALCRGENVTLFMGLLAALQALLSRYTWQDDIVVGIPVANRLRSELEVQIGFFVNSLVLRTDLSGNPTFRELLRRVREGTLNAYSHQDLPFDKLMEALQPTRDLSFHPLFQIFFRVGDQLQLPELPNLDISLYPIDRNAAKFDIELTVTETDEELVAWVNYNTDIFEANTISRMLKDFEALLTEVTNHPERRLHDIPLLDNQEQQEKHSSVYTFQNTDQFIFDG